MIWRIFAQLVQLKPLSNLGMIAIVFISLSCETANKKKTRTEKCTEYFGICKNDSKSFFVWCGYHVALVVSENHEIKVCDDCKELRKQSKDWPHLCLKHWKLNVWLTSPVSSGFRDKTSKSKCPSLVSHLVILLRKQKCL